MNSNLINVLVFPCGSEPGSEIYHALRRSIHVKVYGASSVDDHGRFVYDNYIGGVPKINDDAFFDAFADIIRLHSIHVVFSTHDTVSVHLSKLASRLGFHLVNGDSNTVEICRSKLKTYSVLGEMPWLPDVYNEATALAEFPVIAKPDAGQGGQGVHLVHTQDEVNVLLQDMTERWAIVEYLPGDEITVDCFTDWERDLIWMGARSRERVKAGISMRSQFLPADEVISDIAQVINHKIVMRGPWFFQLKKDRKGLWKLLEVSCRIAGTMVAHRAKGINLPLMAIQDFMKRKQSTLPISEVAMIDRRLVSEAQFDFVFDTCIIDYDDTIVCSKTGLAFPEAIAFLYKMLEIGKRIVLITRHQHELSVSMARARVSESLFDEIVHLKLDERKSDFVRKGAIFVDNHFPERLDVARVSKCPVFDVDTVSLINWSAAASY